MRAIAQNPALDGSDRKLQCCEDIEGRVVDYLVGDLRRSISYPWALAIRLRLRALNASSSAFRSMDMPYSRTALGEVGDIAKTSLPL